MYKTIHQLFFATINCCINGGLMMQMNVSLLVFPLAGTN